MKQVFKSALCLFLLLLSVTFAQSEDSSAVVVSSASVDSATVVESSTISSTGDDSTPSDGIPSDTNPLDGIPSDITSSAASGAEDGVVSSVVSPTASEVASISPTVTESLEQSTAISPSSTVDDLFSTTDVESSSQAPTSDTSGASQEGTATTDTSPSSTPSDGDEGGEAEAYDFEAREETPMESKPDVATPEQHQAEAGANLPVMEIPEEDAREIAALEASMFEHFVRNDPEINPEDNITLPDAVTDCQLGVGKRSNIGDWSGEPSSRLLGRQAPCRAVDRLDFDLHVWHMLSSRGAARPQLIEARIKESVAYLKSVYEPRGIYFKHVSTNFRQPVSETVSWANIRQNEAKLHRWQKASRKGNKMALNLWLVFNLLPETGPEDDGDLIGYATFPEWEKGPIDGVVMQQTAMGTPAALLVHEVGHWLGLRHTFGNNIKRGEKDCRVGDGLRRTTHTRADLDVIFKCEQLPCNANQGVRRIPNFMSYSDCSGLPVASGFHVDQKAAMFARTMKYRRTNKPGDCTYLDPKDDKGLKARGVQKRSGMQDLVDGKCPDLDAEAERIQDEPADDSGQNGTGDGAGENESTGSGDQGEPTGSADQDEPSGGTPGVVLHNWAWCLLLLTSFMVILG